FSPAEVNLLFPAPFSPRRLLAYKLMVSLATCAVLAPFMVLATAVYTGNLFSALVGIFLALAFLQLYSTAVGLAGNSVGALAHNRHRKAVLIGLAVLGLAAVLPLGAEVLRLDPRALVARLEQSPVARALSATA